jgi:hypothetical protein
MSLKECIEIMKKEVKNQQAQAYLEALDEVVEKDGMKGLVIQIKYIKENIKSWRGENARNVKEYINDWIEIKKKENL